MVHRVALGLNIWHLTMQILALLPAEGEPGQAGLGVYAQWVHSQAFITLVSGPGPFAGWHQVPFRSAADGVGLLLEPSVLPYLQLAPMPLSTSTFPQGALKSSSVVRRGGGVMPPQPLQDLRALGVWHSVLFQGVFRCCDMVNGRQIPADLSLLASMWRSVYVQC